MPRHYHVGGAFAPINVMKCLRVQIFKIKYEYLGFVSRNTVRNDIGCDRTGTKTFRNIDIILDLMSLECKHIFVTINYGKVKS